MSFPTGQVVRIVCASYEGILYGYEAPKGGDGAVDVSSMSESFRYAPVSECIKALGIMQTKGGNILVTGGSGETIRIYDMQRKRDIGALAQHKATITCLEFFRGSHLLSGSEDCSVCIWRTSDWACIHVLGGHKGTVNSIAIHPSGKMALSVSADRTLRMWNLVKGRCAFIKRLAAEATQVIWNASGTRYATVQGEIVQMDTASDTDTSVILQHNKRINAIQFIGDEVVATGGEDRKVRLWDAQGRELCVMETGSRSRIKTMKLMHTGSSAYLVSADSLGSVQIWDVSVFLTGVDADEIEEPELVQAITLASEPRLTCMAVFPWNAIAKPAAGEGGKKKTKKVLKKKQASEASAAREDDEDEEEEDDEDMPVANESEDEDSDDDKYLEKEKVTTTAKLVQRKKKEGEKESAERDGDGEIVKPKKAAQMNRQEKRKLVAGTPSGKEAGPKRPKKKQGMATKPKAKPAAPDYEVVGATDKPTSTVVGLAPKKKKAKAKK